jgi:hypothetical protein
MKELSLVNDSLLRQRLTELDSIASWAPHILSGLERFIRTAGDYDLFRVNPIQYATATGLSEAEGIELFVHAAKVGLFEMQWLLTCAYCPQVAGSFRELGACPGNGLGIERSEFGSGFLRGDKFLLSVRLRVL